MCILKFGYGVTIVIVFDKAVETCGTFVGGCGGVVVAGAVGGCGAEVGFGGVAVDDD